jgi:hypothetical protein
MAFLSLNELRIFHALKNAEPDTDVKRSVSGIRRKPLWHLITNALSALFFIDKGEHAKT